MSFQLPTPVTPFAALQKSKREHETSPEGKPRFGITILWDDPKKIWKSIPQIFQNQTITQICVYINKHNYYVYIYIYIYMCTYIYIYIIIYYIYSIYIAECVPIIVTTEHEKMYNSWDRPSPWQETFNALAVPGPWCLTHHCTVARLFQSCTGWKPGSKHTEHSC